MLLYLVQYVLIRLLKKTEKMKKYLLYILTLFFGQLQAQDLPKLSATTDTLQIRMGEQIKMSVEAETDTLSFVDFPEVSELGEMEVVASTTVDTLQAKPYRKLLKKYFITQWDSGDYVLAPLAVKINDTVLYTDSLLVKILPVAVDTTQQDLYGYKPPVDMNGEESVETAGNFSPWWWLVLLPLLALAYYLYKRRKAVMEARKKALSAYEKALVGLKKLTEEKLWLKDKVDQHYLRLTDLLKEYLEGELKLSAKEKISSEILLDLQKYRFEDGRYFPAEMLERLKLTFQRADLAKFAKLVPNPSDVDLDINNIKDLIEYAHGIVQSIADARAAELAEKEAAKRRKKQIAGVVAGVIFMLLLLLGGSVYYWLNKNDLTKNISENISSPEWVYSEYGSSPAIGLTTPHILHWYDLQSALDTIPQLKGLFEETTFYVDQNLVKKYAILVSSMDLKKEIPEDAPVLESTLQGMLQQIQAREVHVQQADIDNGKRFFGDFVMDLPPIGNNVKIAFDSRFYRSKTGVKYVVGLYLYGDEKNRELIERVLNSAELVED